MKNFDIVVQEGPIVVQLCKQSETRADVYWYEFASTEQAEENVAVHYSEDEDDDTRNFDYMESEDSAEFAVDFEQLPNLATALSAAVAVWKQKYT